MILIEKIHHIKRLTADTTVNGTSVKIKQRQWSSCCSNHITFDKRKRLHSPQGCQMTRTTTREAPLKLVKTSNLISSNSISDHPQVAASSAMKEEEQQDCQKHRRRRRRRPRRQLPRRQLDTTAWLLAVLISLTIGINYCTCDTASGANLRKSTPQAHQVRLSEAPKGPVSSSSGKQPVGVEATKTAREKVSPSSHRDQLVETLNETIERQHFRMSLPIRSLVQQRPSKFDSGRQVLKDLAPSEQSTSPKQATGKGASKADDSLRHIMMMHEHAASNHQASLASTTSEGTKLTTRLRHISPGGLLMSQSHQQAGLINSNKIMSQALSYLSPLVRSKPLLDNILAQHIQQSSSSNSSRLKSPFSARANTKISSLQGLGKKFANQSGYLSSSSSSLFSSTDSPKTSVLAKPSPSGDRSKHSSTPMSILDDAQKYFSNQHSNYEPPIDLIADSSSPTGSTSSGKLSAPSNVPTSSKQQPSSSTRAAQLATFNPNDRLPVSSWLKNSANQMAHGYVQDSLRDLLMLSQLPILSGGPISTAPSDLEPGGKKWLANKMAAQQQHQQLAANGGNRSQTLDDILRYAYIFGSGVRRKRDPLKVLGPSKTLALVARRPTSSFFKQRSNKVNKHNGASTVTAPNGLLLFDNKQLLRLRNRLNSMLASNKNAKPRGVMWDMATDPSLAVTVFHLLERASVALPLGFLLMPFVQMIRNPLNGIPLHHHGLNAMNLGRILPARASHRSVDYEELAKRLDMMDKILSRALRQTHREA